MKAEQVKKIAELSRLEFSDAEMEEFSVQFSKIVDYIDVIQDVDLKDVEPMTSVNESTNVLRADVAGTCLTTEEALRNAPKKNEAFIKVPKVL